MGHNLVYSTLNYGTYLSLLYTEYWDIISVQYTE